MAIMEKTFKCYITEDPAAVQIREKLNLLEGELGQVSARSGKTMTAQP